MGRLIVGEYKKGTLENLHGKTQKTIEVDDLDKLATPETDFYIYEVMDRSYSVFTMFCEILYEDSEKCHQGFEDRPELEEAALDAFNALFGLYQKAAGCHLRSNKHLLRKSDEQKKD